MRREIERFRGQELKNEGDGFLATFDGPARAVECARSIVSAVESVGVRVRAGVHTGEVERVNGEVDGIAVRIGARVADVADGGEVVVSSTVKDLVVGSGLRFRERGRTSLKGVPGEWTLYAVESGG